MTGQESSLQARPYRSIETYDYIAWAKSLDGEVGMRVRGLVLELMRVGRGEVVGVDPEARWDG